MSGRQGMNDPPTAWWD